MASHLDFQHFQVLLKSTHPLQGAYGIKMCRASVEINESRNVASCWLIFGNILVVHAHMNVKFIQNNNFAY